jgi:hypothetical protein
MSDSIRLPVEPSCRDRVREACPRQRLLHVAFWHPSILSQCLMLSPPSLPAHLRSSFISNAQTPRFRSESPPSSILPSSIFHRSSTPSTTSSRSTRAIHRSPSSRQTHTSAAHSSRPEHRRIPVDIVSLLRRTASPSVRRVAIPEHIRHDKQPYM